jgi:hypothetical protein
MAAQAERLGIIRRLRGGTFRFLAGRVTDFGDTFEWYVAELLRRQFQADVLWGVTIPGLSCGETSTSWRSSRGSSSTSKQRPRPSSIEQKEMRAFVARVRKLSPDLAVLIVDTHLRMKDKLAPLLSEALREEGVEDREMVRVEKETFGWGGRLFLTNSKRDIGGNLALCLRSYFLDRFFG